MAGRTLITKWNVLALAVGLVGAAATLALSELSMRRWSESGQRSPIGTWADVELSAGERVVYYETTGEVPVDNVLLTVVDSRGQRLYSRRAPEAPAFRLLTSGYSARAMWLVTVPENGRHRLICHNHNNDSLEAVPADDRVAVEKRPERIDDLLVERRTVQIAGASITMLAVIGLYVMHVAALHHRRIAARTAALAAR